MNQLFAILVVVLVGAVSLSVFVLWRSFRQDPREWHGVYVHRRVVISGRYCGPGPMMRRKVDGQWEYRLMTRAELSDYARMEAW